VEIYPFALWQMWFTKKTLLIREVNIWKLFWLLFQGESLTSQGRKELGKLEVTVVDLMLETISTGE